MAFGTTFEDDLVKLIFNATTIATLASAAGTATNLYLSLHTADPHGGNQSTSEAAYTPYARLAIARTSGGWTVAGNVATLVANAVFATATGSPNETELYAGLGVAASGAGELITSGLLSPSIAVTSAGVAPTITTTTAFTLT
jgi:hypothetical protein